MELTVTADNSAFTYQGRLSSGDSPAEGQFDVVFAVYDSVSGGTPLTSAVTNLNVSIVAGNFSSLVEFGSGVFNGQSRWLEIGVRSNGATGAFEILIPRQQITPAPTALHATTTDSAVTAQTAATVAAGSINSVAIQDGSVTAPKVASGQLVRSVNGLRDDVQLAAGANLTLTTNVNTLVLDSPSWGLTGNSGTAPPTQFLGTTDAQPLEMRVNNLRALRLESAGTVSAINIASGCPDNFILPGISAATISGGGANYGPGTAYSNTVRALSATIAGGVANTIDTNASSAVISGGFSNRIGYLVSDGVISGGSQNSIGDESFRSTISGGWMQNIAADCYHSTIAGGWTNTIAGHSSTIGGGTEHSIGFDARFSTIGGGGGNVIQAGAFTGTIAGGGQNLIGPDSFRCSIGGGKWNQIGNNSPHSTIGGGVTNSILDNAEGSVVPGGAYNTAAGPFSFAAGRRASAKHSGAFVWADPNDAEFQSITNNEFAVRATGGVRMVTGIDGGGSPLSGASLAPGSGSWSTLSDRYAKENFEAADTDEILARVAALPVQTWNYNAQSRAVRHIGPTAQDFHAAFGLGENETTISTVDADGVALAALQGLNRKLEAELARRDAEIQELRKSISGLKQLVEAGGRRTMD
jgi:hypothetical protein